MDFQLLGPFEARHDGALVTVGSRRQERCLLALLLLDGGRIVSTQRLVDMLWDGHPPPAARGTIHTYVGRLRRDLAPYGVTIATRHNGYVVDLDGHVVDAHTFVGLVRAAGEATDPYERVRRYDEALRLWRGPLLADLADEALRLRLDVSLVELRLSATQRRAEALLAMGQHDQVATDLAPVAAQYPTREPIVALLMTALYRCERAAEALRLYELTAKVLDDELGLAPGPELRRVHEQIVRRDRRLDRPPAPVYAVRVRDQWLPWSTAGHPALEFCNTYAGWEGPGGPGHEWLGSYATLAVWTEYMDLADAWTVSRLVRLGRRSPGEATTVLDDARILRAGLYACLTNPEDRDAFATVARFVEDAAKVSVFSLDDNGLGRWRLSPAAGLRLPVHAAAQSAAQLLSDPRRYAVCTCPGTSCGWLFLDGSGRRRFCSVFCSIANCDGPPAGQGATTLAG